MLCGLWRKVSQAQRLNRRNVHLITQYTNGPKFKYDLARRSVHFEECSIIPSGIFPYLKCAKMHRELALWTVTLSTLLQNQVVVSERPFLTIVFMEVSFVWFGVFWWFCFFIMHWLNLGSSASSQHHFCSSLLAGLALNHVDSVYCLLVDQWEKSN